MEKRRRKQEEEEKTKQMALLTPAGYYANSRTKSRSLTIPFLPLTHTPPLPNATRQTSEVPARPRRERKPTRHRAEVSRLECDTHQDGTRRPARQRLRGGKTHKVREQRPRRQYADSESKQHRAGGRCSALQQRARRRRGREPGRRARRGDLQAIPATRPRNTRGEPSTPRVEDPEERNERRDPPT